MSTFGINVFDFGAKGDGVTDDTAAIQAAIDYTAKRGGGKILFPFTPQGYRIASPAIDEIDGKPVRSQLVIPAGTSNIQLEGEMPCRLLYSYQVRPVGSPYGTTYFYPKPRVFTSTTIFSDWEAPEEHDPTARPWSIISTPQGTSCRGKFSSSQITLTNLEFAVPLDHDKMYPTQSCANLQNFSRVHVYDCQFCLLESVGDAVLGKELQPNPCHTAGLITSGDQNDHNVLQNVAVQGFRYGLVCGEHVVANYLYIHNCEEGLTFHDCSHLSVFTHIVAQHNAVIISTTTEDLFGMPKGPCNVLITSVNFECGTNHLPKVSALQYGFKDVENRMNGSITWHKPHGKMEFPVLGGKNTEVKRFYFKTE